MIPAYRVGSIVSTRQPMPSLMTNSFLPCRFALT